MLNVLGIIGPIFILIGLGYASVRHRLLAYGDIRVLGVFVVNLALPALLFRTLSARPLDDLLDVGFLAAYALGSLLTAAAILAFVVLFQRRPLQAGVIAALGASMANSAFIGYPIGQLLYGSAASANLAVYVVVEMLIMLPLLLTLAELGAKASDGRPHHVGIVVARLLRNPLLIGILAGVASALSGWQVPVIVARVLDMLSGATAPVALFYIGGMLAGISVRGMVADLGVVMLGKLVVHPFAVFAAFALLSPGDPGLKVAAVTNACMPMLSIYPVLGQKYGHEALCAMALVATTAVSFFTLAAFLWFAGTAAG